MAKLSWFNMSTVFELAIAKLNLFTLGKLFETTITPKCQQFELQQRQKFLVRASLLRSISVIYFTSIG